MGSSRARAWFAATALVVAFGLVVQVAVSANAAGVHFHTPLARALNVFCFFTIQSNILVGVASLLLALSPSRTSTAFRAFRLTGLVAITVTGIVYHSVLAKLLDLDSWALVADHALHTAVPIMAVVGWLAFGPRGQLSSRIVRLSLIFPIAWLAFTLIRGAIIDFYPYPFVNVTHLGYARVLVNVVWIAVLYLAAGFGAAALDRWLMRLRRDPAPAVP
ncbi:MAG: Pr6Pr family membrane protein [Actinomycetota bacterium]